jgi:hypothetical protein
MNERADARAEQPKQPSLIARLSSLQGALAVVGLFMYGALYIAYANFYNRLGVRPEDVGLGYGTTILRSSGLIVLLVIPLVVVSAVIIFLRRRRRSTLERTSSSAVDLLVPASFKPSESRTTGDQTPQIDVSALGESVVVVVPASIKAGQSPPSTGQSPSSGSQYRPTNLAVVADWVTKILIGVLLVALPVFTSVRLPNAVASRVTDVEQGR